MFKTDHGGVAMALRDVKLITSKHSSTWNTRLSQIRRSKSRIDICTYSLPSLDYIAQILDKRAENVHIVAHTKFARQAQRLRELYPKLDIVLRHDVHAKMVLIEPDTVWLSSANFGSSRWFEHTIGIHSEEAYQFYLNELMGYLRG